jgi:hypothetical protein
MKRLPTLEMAGNEYVVSNVGSYDVRYLAKDRASGNLLLLLRREDSKDSRLFVGSPQKGMAECEILDTAEDEFNVGFGLSRSVFGESGFTVLIDPKLFPEKLPVLCTLGGKRYLAVEKFQLR